MLEEEPRRFNRVTQELNKNKGCQRLLQVYKKEKTLWESLQMPETE